MRTDAYSMLEKVSKELKLADYTLTRIVTSGTDHFTKLKVTTAQEVNIYRDHIQKHGLRAAQHNQNIKKPFTRLDIIDTHPLQVLIQAEGRRGHCKLVLRGKIPDELQMYASEIYQDPTE